MTCILGPSFRRVVAGGALLMASLVTPASAAPLTMTYRFEGQVVIDPATNQKDFDLLFFISQASSGFHSLHWNGLSFVPPESPSLSAAVAIDSVIAAANNAWNFTFFDDISLGDFAVDFEQVLPEGPQQPVGTVSWVGDGNVSYPLAPGYNNYLVADGFVTGKSYFALISGTDPFTGFISFGPAAASGVPEMDAARALTPLAFAAMALVCLSHRRRRSQAATIS